jgi:hypothetical protein
MSAFCDYARCTARAGCYIPVREISLSVREALLGYEQSQCYKGWESNPFFYGLCAQHYRQLRRKDGYALGYRTINGKIRAYVKEEYF